MTFSRANEIVQEYSFLGMTSYPLEREMVTEGWVFRLSMEVPDRDDGRLRTIHMRLTAPPFDNENLFRAWIHGQYREFWNHEFEERYQKNGQRVYNPHWVEEGLMSHEVVL